MDEFDQMIAEFIEGKRKNAQDPDILDRSKMIGDISEMISHRLYSKEPMSLAVMGMWGVGKTFILNEIEKKFSSKCIIFHYDCWKNDYYEEPLVGILSVIVGQLNTIESQNPDKQQDHYYALMKQFIVQLSQCVTQHFAVADIVNIGNIFALIKDKVKQKKAVELKPWKSLASISDIIETINNLLCGYMAYEGKKILFVVDELDRCLPDYSLKVLNRLHHICSETPLIQVVAINDRELKANINGLYARDDEEDGSFAKSYLQRFFTDFYRIPVGDSRELLKLCWKNIDKYFYNRTDEDFFSLFLVSVLNNSNYTIREKKMILNLFRNYHIQTLGSSKEKFPYELACAEILEMIRLFYNLEQDWKWENDCVAVPLPSLDEDVDEELPMTDTSSENGSNLYTLSINAPHSIFYKKIEPVKDFFLQECKRKYEAIENGTLAKETITSSDFVIAFFQKCMELPGEETDSDMSTIIEKLKSDEKFKKGFGFFESFRNKICV